MGRYRKSYTNTMKMNSAEIIKNQAESGDLKQMLEDAKMMVANEQIEARESEEDAKSLELDLLQAQAAHERREEAERQGKETTEKITELTG